MDEVTRIGLAGDWHGSKGWAVRCIDAFADAGISEIHHLGDFGFWPGPKGREYLLDLEALLAAHDMVMFVTPGNHEDYDAIAEVPALDLDHDIGEVQWFTDHIAALPRGHRFERNGWSFVSLGGAPSIDYEIRTAGRDWWPAELITEDDVARVVADGPADVMLTHDAPDAQYGSDAVARILTSNPMGWSRKALAYAALGRHRMTNAFLGVQPRLFAHGHFHVKGDTTRDVFDHSTRTLSLDCDGSLDGNLAILDLPENEPGVDIGVEWVNLPAATRPSLPYRPPPLDGLPAKPVVDWGIKGLLLALDDGRSAHWNAICRVVVRDQPPALMYELQVAMRSTRNDAAHAYVTRKLAGVVEFGQHSSPDA